MKLVSTILLVTLLISCQKQNSTKSAILHSDTLITSVESIIDDRKIAVKLFSDNNLYIINSSSNDTLITFNDEGIQGVKFEDFNNDGNYDVRIGFNSNYFFETIFIYDSDLNTFKQIEEIDDPDYAYSENLYGTNIYFSYSPYLCGKNNWISRLFLIENFKIRDIGIIRYHQCKDEEQGIFVYRIEDKLEKFVEKFPLTEEDKYDVAFYRQYWNSRSKNFH